MSLINTADSPAQSQTTPSTTVSKKSKPRLGSVVGMVFDSLHSRPLANAEVLAEGETVSLTHTDQAGQFTATLPVGKYRVSISHPSLDSLGVTLSTPEFYVLRDSTSLVRLSVPSATGLIKIFCNSSSAASGLSMLTGQVQSTESESPLRDAEVTLSWTTYQVSNAGVEKTQHAQRDTTGPSGHYHFCGLPTDLQARLETRFAGELRSISTVIIADTGSKVTVKNVVLRPGTVSPENLATVAGRVELPDGRPAQGSRVEILSSGQHATTDDRGRFTLDSVVPGHATISAKLLGYAADSVSLIVAPSTGQGIVVRLKASVPVLSTVKVSANIRDQALDRVGFTRRSQHSVGHFLNGEEIGRRSDFQFTDLLRGIPGLSVGIDKYGDDVVTSSRAGGSILNSTNGCVQYFVDGQPWGNAALESMGMARPQDSAANKMLARLALETARQINAVVKRSDVLGIEVYQGGGAPTYFNQGGHNCATVVIWTVASITP